MNESSKTARALRGVGVGLYRSVLALGVGGTAMFIVFAPVLFGVIPEAYPVDGRHLSGQVVTRTLGVLQGWGLIGGVLSAALGAGLFWREDGWPLRLLRVGGGVLITALSAVSLWGVAAEMEALREAMGVIDQIPVDDARRVAFNTLHKVSSGVHLAIVGLTLAQLVAPGDWARRARRSDP